MPPFWGIKKIRKLKIIAGTISFTSLRVRLPETHILWFKATGEFYLPIKSDSDTRRKLIEII